MTIRFLWGRASAVAVILMLSLALASCAGALPGSPPDSAPGPQAETPAEESTISAGGSTISPIDKPEAEAMEAPIVVPTPDEGRPSREELAALIPPTAEASAPPEVKPAVREVEAATPRSKDVQSTTAPAAPEVQTDSTSPAPAVPSEKSTVSTETATVGEAPTVANAPSPTPALRRGGSVGAAQPKSRASRLGSTASP